jgi:hypothetical protein
LEKRHVELVALAQEMPNNEAIRNTADEDVTTAVPRIVAGLANGFANLKQDGNYPALAVKNPSSVLGCDKQEIAEVMMSDGGSKVASAEFHFFWQWCDMPNKDYRSEQISSAEVDRIFADWSTKIKTALGPGWVYRVKMHNGRQQMLGKFRGGGRFIDFRNQYNSNDSDATVSVNIASAANG